MIGIMILLFVTGIPIVRILIVRIVGIVIVRIIIVKQNLYT